MAVDSSKRRNQMKILLAIFISLFLSVVLACPVLGQNQSGNLEGNWLGTLDVSGVKLRLVLKIQKTGEGYRATFDSVDQDAKDLLIDSITLKGNKMSFSAAQYGIRYDGIVNDNTDEISGTFEQGPTSFPLVFK